MSQQSIPKETISETPNPAFDDSRIKDHPDKQLLSRIRLYFDAFATGNAEALRDLEADEYTMTDISLALVRLPKQSWYLSNKGFTSLTTDTKVTAISLYGSSAPGEFAIMENAISFKLTDDPPEQAKASLPPGIKKGDSAGMIMLSVLWWNADGKITQELEYGRLTWEGFDIGVFDKSE